MSDTTARPIATDPAAEARLKRVVQRIYDLPSFPVVIQKLQEVAEDPNSSSKRMAEVMEKDQGLSAKILKLVNSAFYSFSKPVSSLQHAITLLGYNSIRSLAMSVSMKGLLRVDSKTFHSERFWEHALAVGTATRYFAELHRFPLKEDAFTAGLMHDVGILLEAKYFPEELAEVGERVAAGAGTLVEVEREVLGVDHGLLAAWLAERWRLPLLLQAPMLRHHELAEQPLAESECEELEGDLIKVLCFVTAADLLATALGLGHGVGCAKREAGAQSGVETEIELSLPPHLADVLGGRSVAEIATEVRERFEASRSFLTV